MDRSLIILSIDLCMTGMAYDRFSNEPPRDDKEMVCGGAFHSQAEKQSVGGHQIGPGKNSHYYYRIA